MTQMIKLSMYIDQRSGGKGNKSQDTVASGSFKIPFSSWLVGYVVVSSRSSTPGEEWTIKEIKSTDGKLRREDCEATLINSAAEVRLVKGSTLQSGYEFKSTGDLPPPATNERTDVKEFGIDLEGIREFYPRNNAEGTRVIMHDKTVYIVLEKFDYIWRKFKEAGLSVGAHDEYRKRKTNEGAMTGAELEGN